MRWNNFFSVVALALVIAGSFIVLHLAGNSKNSNDCRETKQVCCKCKKPQSSPQGDMIWETLSRQFYS
ncbi:MAG TPA: hypothetical protein VHD35_09815 [Chitinophagaceae bacterium]|nr:hypothetical protein [Chitinophagaceae bacterium]